MNFASNAVFGKNPKFVDLGLSIAHTADKLKSVIGPATRVQGLTESSDGLTSSQGISNFGPVSQEGAGTPSHSTLPLINFRP